MKQSLLRTAAFLLAALMTVPIMNSCGGDSKTSTETAPQNDTASATEAVTIDPNNPASAKDSLPDGLDFGGKTFRIYNANQNHQIYYEESE